MEDRIDRVRHLWSSGPWLLQRSRHPSALRHGHPQPLEGKTSIQPQLWPPKLSVSGLEKGTRDSLRGRKGLVCRIHVRSRTPIRHSGNTNQLNPIRGSNLSQVTIVLSTGQPSWTQIFSLITSVMSLSWGASRAFLILRPADKADPDPELTTVLLRIWPYMLDSLCSRSNWRGLDDLAQHDLNQPIQIV